MSEENLSDLISNFKNILSNSNSKTENISTNNENSQNSNLNITPDMISNLSSILKKSSDSKQKDETDDFAKNIDIDTIMKIQNIIEKLNKKDDPRAKLLYSLKPYLRESKKKKLEQYVNLLKITSISELFIKRKWR